MAKISSNAQAIFNAIIKDERISGLTSLGFETFEKAFDEAYQERPKSALPPITRSHFQEPRGQLSYFALFETLTLAIRKAHYSEDNSLPKDIPTYSGGDIRDGILKFVHFEDCDNPSKVEPRLKVSPREWKEDPFSDFDLERAKPHALKMVGCRIEGDIDLSNLRINGSIRLVGCIIEGALILDRTQLVTLDLSGSIITKGISGMYMTAEGAFRMRRAVSQGPVDLGGLEANGTVDFTDCILSPENEPSFRASYVRDRGILNIAQSTLKRDLRMERARIYGGINLRGANVGGMFHLNDAILRSPMAHFEYIASKTLRLIEEKTNEELPKSKRKRSARLNARFPQKLSQTAVKKIAEQLHPGCLNKEGSPLQIKECNHGDLFEIGERRKWEQLGSSIHSETAISSDSNLQKNLMFGDVATAESAIRAEQLTVEGPIYARGLRTSGRIRLKHLSTGGNLSLNGSRLRSAKDVRIGIEALREYFRTEEELEQSTRKYRNARIKRKQVANLAPRYKALNSSYIGIIDIFKKWLKESPYSDIHIKGSGNNSKADYVIDLDHARIKGDVDFGYDDRDARTIQLYEPALRAAFRRIRWALLNRYAYKNTEVAKKSIISWFNDVDPLSSGGYRKFSREKLPTHFYEKYIRSDPEPPPFNPTLIVGDVKLDNVVTQGSVYFRGTVFNPSKTYKPSKKKSIRARNIEIRLHLDLRESVGLNGICLTSAKIGGSVRCYDLDLTDKTTRQPVLSRMAFCRPIYDDGHPRTNSKGRVLVDFDLNLARIGGSAYLTFHPEHGPNITFEEGHVENQTYIFAPDFFFSARQPSEQKDDSRSTYRKVADYLLVLAKIILPEFINRVLPSPTDRASQKKVSQSDPTAYPIINFRGLSSSFLSHNPGAWPMPGFLMIRNVRYESTDDYGHLYPLTRTKQQSEEEQEENRDIHRKERTKFWLALFSVILVLILFFILNAFSYTNCYPGEMDCFAMQMVEPWSRIVRAFGAFNIGLLIAFVVMLGVLQGWSKRIHPRKRNAKPLAIFWLNGQREHLNTRRTHHYILPTEPYIRAAAVLRAANRNTSASGVERDRLRVRRKALSRSKAFPTKTLLKLIDLFIGYGFKPSRGVLLTVFYALFASVVFHGAKTNGVIVPSDIVDLYEERRVLGPHAKRNGQNGHLDRRDSDNDTHEVDGGVALQPNRADKRRAAEQSKEHSCLAVLEDLSDNHFRSLLFTIDSLVPFIDMDIETDWKVMDPARFSTILNCENDEHIKARMLSNRVYMLAVFIKILGWALITALAFSLLTRFETLLIRQNS